MGKRPPPQSVPVVDSTCAPLLAHAHTVSPLLAHSVPLARSRSRTQWPPCSLTLTHTVAPLLAHSVPLARSQCPHCTSF